MLTYFINYDVMEQWFEKSEIEDKFGFRIVGRPDAGFAHYETVEYKGKFSALNRYLEPNQTLMIEVVLERKVDEDVFSLVQDQNADGGEIPRTPSGRRL